MGIGSAVWIMRPGLNVVAGRCAVFTVSLTSPNWRPLQDQCLVLAKNELLRRTMLNQMSPCQRRQDFGGEMGCARGPVVLMEDKICETGHVPNGDQLFSPSGVQTLCFITMRVSFLIQSAISTTKVMMIQFATKQVIYCLLDFP
jgi:hypothetical protein